MTMISSISGGGGAVMVFSPNQRHLPLFPTSRPRLLPLFSSSNRQSSLRLFAANSPPPSSSAGSQRDLFFLRLSASVFFFLGLSFKCFESASAALPVSVAESTPLEECVHQDKESKKMDEEDLEDEEMRKAFEKWKSKTYSLTMPLRIVSLSGSVPPFWIKDFVQCEGKRSNLKLEFRGRLEGIFSEISATSQGKANPKSASVADLITIGDSWLDLAIKRAMIEPIQAAENQDWFTSLPQKWKEKGGEVFALLVGGRASEQLTPVSTTSSEGRVGKIFNLIG